MGRKKPRGLAENIHPITFCQAVTIARQGGYSIYLERETLACYNARIFLGIGTEQEINKDIETSIETNTGKYAPTKEMAAKIVRNKFRIPAGKVKGVGIAQLGWVGFVPDALIILLSSVSQFLSLYLKHTSSKQRIYLMRILLNQMILRRKK